MARKAINFRLPDKTEWILIVLMFIAFSVFDEAQNRYQDLQGNIHTPYFFSDAITMFWVGIILYHGLLFGLIGRAIQKQSTHYFFDAVVGGLMVLGTFMLIGGALGATYLRPDDAVTWFFNLSQITMYHFGVAMQVIGVIYFIVTD